LQILKLLVGIKKKVSCQIKDMTTSSQFLSLAGRSISTEIFFDCLLSNEDLSKLLCTCRGMKLVILEAKRVFPIQKVIINDLMTHSRLNNMISHFSNKIEKLVIPFGNGFLWKIHGYHIIALLHSNLKSLDFPSCSSAGLAILLASTLTNLTSLAMSDCTDDIDLVFKSLSTLIKLKSLKIRRFEGLTGVGLAYLGANERLLTQLTIEDCRTIPSDGFECLTLLTNLTILSIRRTNLDSNGLFFICWKCGAIKDLEISDVDSKKFYKRLLFFLFQNLQSLTLNFCDKSLKSLVRVNLVNNPRLTLTKLKLNMAGISNHEQFYLHLASLVNLEHLTLTANSDNDENGVLSNDKLSNLSSLARLTNLTIDEFAIFFCDLFHLSSIVFLTIQNCIIFPDGRVNMEYPFLENLKHLSLIDICTGEYFNDELLFSLPTNLTYLNIVQNGEEYPGLDRRMLENFSSLVYLTHFSFKHIDYRRNNFDAGLSYLSTLSNLDYLSLNEPLNDENLLCLSSLSNLTHLSLGVNCIISNIGLSHLSSLLKLSHLRLGRESSISDIGLSYLSSHSSLTYLNLGKNSSITKHGLSYLSSLVNLTLLVFNPEGKISYQDISTLTSLTILSDISSLFLSY
jgi:hypothetical protein